MNCQNHPDKEAVANCAVCGKPVCKECLIEIAGNTYCKDCVSELVTASIVEKAMKDKAPATEEKETISEPVKETIPEPEPITEEVKAPEVEPVKDIEDEAAEEGDYDFENQFEEEPEPVTEEIQSGGHKFRSAASISSLLEEEGIGKEPAGYGAAAKSPIKEPVFEAPEPEPVQEEVKAPEVEPVYSEADYYKDETPSKTEESFDNLEQGPDEELEAKYEKYLEDLYYDEPEKSEQTTIEGSPVNEPLSLQDQLAQDEARNGPLTNKPFEPDTYYEGDELSSGMSNNYSNETYTSSLSDAEDEDVIVPVHMQNAENDGGMSYEEIRERLLAEEGYVEDDGQVGTNRVQTAYASQQEDYEREMNNTGVAAGVGAAVASKFHRGNDVQDSIYAREEEPQYYMDESEYYYDYPEQDLSGVRNIHQTQRSSRREDEEKFSVAEIILTIILIVLILIVIAYVIYLFTLSGDYPTFIDAVTVLFTNPGQLISNIFH